MLDADELSHCTSWLALTLSNGYQAATMPNKPLLPLLKAAQNESQAVVPPELLQGAVCTCFELATTLPPNAQWSNSNRDGMVAFLQLGAYLGTHR